MFGFDLGSIAKGFGEGIIGPIASIFNKKQDVDLEKYKVNGQINIEAMKQDVALTKAVAEVAQARKDDPTDRWGRRLFIYPTGAWYAFIVYFCVFSHLFPQYTWVIKALPPNLEYVPYTVIGYLFVRLIRK